MRIIEAPNHAHLHAHEVSVFLGGGITDCPDWQADLLKTIEPSFNKLPVVAFNPRRSSYEHTRDAAIRQIEWEFDQLQRSDVIVFWFPKETLCPITLYELGFQMGRRYEGGGTSVIVGTHPQYARTLDVQFQTYLVNRAISVTTTWEWFVELTAKKIAETLNQRE